VRTPIRRGLLPSSRNEFPAAGSSDNVVVVVDRMAATPAPTLDPTGRYAEDDDDDYNVYTEITSLKWCVMCRRSSS